VIWFVAVAVVIVGGAAAACWWWTTTRLSRSEATAIYDIEEASDFAAARLPNEVNARLDRGLLQEILALHLEFFRQAGMATYGGVDEIAMEAAAKGETVVAHEDEAIDWIVDRLAERGTTAELVDVVVVVDLSNQYLASIGALGPSVTLGE